MGNFFCELKFAIFLIAAHMYGIGIGTDHPHVWE